MRTGMEQQKSKERQKINVNVHVYKERNCHNGNTQWLSRRHHYRSLETTRSESM